MEGLRSGLSVRFTEPTVTVRLVDQNNSSVLCFSTLKLFIPPNVTLRLTVIHIFLPLTGHDLMSITVNISYFSQRFWSKLSEYRRYSDRFVVRNSFSLCENKNKLAEAMLGFSDMWFPVKKKKMRGNRA